MEGDRDKCIAAGMDDHLAKPFLISQMSEVLSRWLPGRTRPGPEAGAERSEGTPEALEKRAAEATPPIDVAVLESIRALQQEGGPDLVARVVGLYLDGSGKQMEILRSGVKTSDAEAVHRSAHGLKSSSASVGAMRLSGLLKELESMARAKDLQMAGDALAEIETEYLAAREALSRLSPERTT
jgi:HPt (histidine-containing phosphotransfer) domain-containing protein